MNIDRPKESKWSSGLCGCGGSGFTCCITCLFPCITFGQIAEVVDEGRSSCMANGCVYALLMMVQFHWLYSCIYRKKLRSKFGLPSEPCCDCCVHFCCETCALCQEHSELKFRRFDPSKGWAGQPTTTPPMPPSMQYRSPGSHI